METMPLSGEQGDLSSVDRLIDSFSIMGNKLLADYSRLVGKSFALFVGDIDGNA